MSKFTTKFSEKTSNAWCNNPEYNKMLIKSRIVYLEDVMKIHGVLILKEALDAFGINIRGISIDILTRYWIDGGIDISYVDLGYNEYELIFKTDN